MYVRRCWIEYFGRWCRTRGPSVKLLKSVQMFMVCLRHCLSLSANHCSRLGVTARCVSVLAEWVCHITVTWILAYGHLFSCMQHVCVNTEIPLDLLVCVRRRAPMSTAITALEALSFLYTVYYSFTDRIRTYVFLHVYVEHLKLLLSFILLFWRFRSILGVYDSCVYLKCVPPLGVDHVLKELDSAFRHRSVYMQCLPLLTPLYFVHMGWWHYCLRAVVRDAHQVTNRGCGCIHTYVCTYVCDSMWHGCVMGCLL